MFTKQDLEFSQLLSNINLDLLMHDNEGFREQIIYVLEKAFGYQNIDIWLADAKGRLFNPVSSIASDFIEEYQRKWFQYDFLHPFQIGIDKCMANSTLAIDQVVDKRSYENSPYCEFLRNFNLYHELGSYTKADDELIACIAVLRAENEQPFQLQDHINMQTISNILSPMLKMARHYSNQKAYEEFFKAFSDSSANGAVIFETPHKVLYYNQIAVDLCKQLHSKPFNDVSAVTEFIRSLRKYDSSKWAIGFSKTFYLPDYGAVDVRILPATETEELLPDHPKKYMMLMEQNTKVATASHQPSLNEAYQFSLREMEIINLLKSGHTNDEIAKELCLSVNTVKKAVSKIYGKVGVNNRTGLLHYLSKATKRSA